LLVAASVRVGVHTSIAGGLVNAAERAHKIGCDGFQIFSANPRGWRTKDPTAEDCEKLRAARERYRLTPLVIHDNYLINLASPDERLRELSVAAFRREIERAIAIEADFLVTHPGSARDGNRADAIRQCAESLKQAANGFKLDGLTILIENTAGQGNVIGSRFEEVADIVGAASGELPAGACIDTAHTLEAGYPIQTGEGLAETVRALESTVGLDRVRVIHANDSKTAFGSHADRHEHIGRGKIGREAFARIVRHPELRRIPFICETPIDRPGDDKRNLNMMRKLAGDTRYEEKAVKSRRGQ
jgi:deoxyribonuclease IV